MRWILRWHVGFRERLSKSLAWFVGLKNKKTPTMEEFFLSVEGITPEAPENNASFGKDLFDIQSTGPVPNRRFYRNLIRLQHSCSFIDCEFIRCSFEQFDRVSRIEFLNCKFTECVFERGDYGRIFIKGGAFDNLIIARDFNVMELRVSGATGIETWAGLENIQFVSKEKLSSFERDLSTASVPFGYKFFSWSKLRGFGGLPFFGFSYVGTALILFLLSVIDSYNAQIRSFNEWAGSDQSTGSFSYLPKHFHAIDLDWQTPSLLLGAALLIVASTIYAWKCPERIKEFSLERWTNELGKEAINYVPLTWRNPILRVVCGACFYAGSTITAVVLVVRLGQGFSQAWRNW